MGKAPRKQLAFRSKPFPARRATVNTSRRSPPPDRTDSVNTHRVQQLLQQMREALDRFSDSMRDLFDQMASAMDAGVSSASAPSHSASPSVVVVDNEAAISNDEVDENNNDGH